MFDESSKYYDLIYGFKDYRRESAFLRDLIKRVAPDAGTLLDVGCGTGEHIRYMSDYYFEGIDVNPSFLEIARRKMPGVRFYLADMRDFSLGRTYDVITCLFSSIGYLLDDVDVISAFTCFRRHLAPGGVALVEPWFEPHVWQPGGVHMRSAEDGEPKMCRITQRRVEEEFSILVAHHLVAESGEVRYFTETHRMRLLAREHLFRLFRRASLDPEYIEGGLDGRGLYVVRL